MTFDLKSKRYVQYKQILKVLFIDKKIRTYGTLYYMTPSYRKNTHANTGASVSVCDCQVFSNVNTVNHNEQLGSAVNNYKY